MLGREEVEEIMREILVECNDCLLRGIVFEEGEKREEKEMTKEEELIEILQNRSHFFHECRNGVRAILNVCKREQKQALSSSSSSSPPLSPPPSPPPLSPPPSSSPLSTKELLQKRNLSPQTLLKQVQKMREITVKSLTIIDIDTLADSQQTRILSWVFKNEDLVWRRRGRVNEYETLASYLAFCRFFFVFFCFFLFLFFCFFVFLFLFCFNFFFVCFFFCLFFFFVDGVEVLFIFLIKIIVCFILGKVQFFILNLFRESLLFRAQWTPVRFFLFFPLSFSSFKRWLSLFFYFIFSKKKQQSFPLNKIVGYCVGEFVHYHTYEIVTAWVDTEHRSFLFSLFFFFSLSLLSIL